MISAKCPYCGEGSARYLAQRKDAKRVYRCATCDLLFIYPLPTPEEIKSYYKKGYFEGQGGSSYQDYLRIQMELLNNRNSFWHSRLKIIETISNRPDKILDIGCAHGFFLRVARDNGWEVFGLELSEEAASYARQYFGFQVVTEDLAHANFHNEYFNVITMWDLLEHVLDFQSFIQNVTRILKKGGILALATPNAALGKILRDRWTGFHTSFEHIYFFSPKFLKNFFTLQGYEIVEYRTNLKLAAGFSPDSHSLLGFTSHLRNNAGLKKILRPAKRVVEKVAESCNAGGVLTMYLRKK